MFRRALSIATLIVVALVSLCPPGGAQTLTGGSLRGVVRSAAQQAVAAVDVRLLGATSRSTVTDDAGAFAFDNVPPGLYTLNVIKAGFASTQQDITIAPGTTTNATVELQASSLSTVQTIGRVSTTSGASRINTSTAATSTISGDSFIDQGQLTVTHALNEIPGVQIGLTTDFYGTGLENGANPAVTGLPLVRGALPYETESLIDGHPINIGLNGTFNPAFINPYVLQDVEVVKGPGSSATNIFNAIGGTINFRTLEPTAKPQQSIDVGVDQFGGQTGNVRATGTTLGGKFAYAFDYATYGTQGFDRGFNPLDPMVVFGPGDTINGQTACGNPAATGCSLGVYVPPQSQFIGNPNYQNAVDYVTTFFGCCQNIPMGLNSRNELGKLRYNFTPSTSLTFTYLGGQLRSQIGGSGGYSLPDYYFVPPAGYTGSYPALTELPYDIQDVGMDYVNANLYSAEFRTAVGPISVNARYYSASDSDYDERFPLGGTGYSELLYGGLPLGNNTAPTIFNGQEANIFENFFQTSAESDKLSGYTLQLAAPVGNNVFTVSYDSVDTKSQASQFESSGYTPILFPGSGQKFQTIAAQAQLQLTPSLQAHIADYATLYDDHYTQDFGQSFIDSTHAYNVPRMSFVWRPESNISVRASAGYSVTAPYLSLLENTAAAPAQFPIVYATVTNNAGSIQPETAFGWDLGSDVRIGRVTTVSADIYETTLHNQFLSTTTLSPTPYVLGANNAYVDPPGSYPLYITQTANLGHSRYEGIELALNRAPATGFGYKLQGSLQRAYVYDLPADFYDTASGPNTTNLGILPNENFTTSGNGYNGIAYTRVPYSQGYGEINYRLRNNAFFLLGATYYGPNNSYNEPAFAVVSGSFSQPVGKNVSLLLAVTNITDAYPGLFPNDYGGVPVPLVNGKIGYDPANVVGPSTASVTLRLRF